MAHAERKADNAARELIRQGHWRPSSANAESRTVEVVWTTGADVTRQDPRSGAFFTERLHVPGANLDRLRAGAPLLDSHETQGVRNQLGVVDDAWIEQGRGVARVRFSERAADVFEDVASGVIRNVSVGYSRERERELDDVSADGLPIVLVDRWTPHELSFVTVGADHGAQVRAASPARKEDLRMPETENRNADNGAPPKRRANLDEVAEAIRSREILRACERVDLPIAFARTLIDQGLPLQEARARIIDAIADDPINDTEIDTRFSPGDNDSRAADFATDAAEGLLAREHVIRDVKSPHARQFSGMTFVEVAQRAAALHGTSLSGTRDKITLLKRAFNTSTTLADTVATFSSRSMMEAYQAAPRTFLDAFRQSSAPNFRNNERIRLSDAPALAEVAEGGTFAEVLLSDRKETYVVKKYGHILAFTFEAMINDDLSALTRQAERAGFSASTTESDVFWSLVTTNGNLSDATPIFDAGEGTLISGVALTADALEDAREAFRQRVTENAVALNLMPRYLFVAPDLERTAEKLLAAPRAFSTTDQTTVLSAAYAGNLELRVEPRLPAGDYLIAADYRQIDTLEFAWLSDRPGPWIESDVEFETMGIKYRVTDVFGAGALDRRGLLYNDAV